MVKLKIWDRYVKAAERLDILGRLLTDVREELEHVTPENADETFAKSEELLREYSDALDEYATCDYAGNYTNVIDHYIIKSDRELMIKIMRCVANTEEWTHEQVAGMARGFLKDREIA